MAHPNEEFLRESYDIFAKGDMQALSEMFAEDIAFHAPGRGPLSGVYRGKEEVLSFLGRLFELSGGTFTAELHDVLGNDGHAVGLQTSRAEREGKTLETHDVLVAHIRDGKFREIWFHSDDTQAADEFWS